MKLGEAVPLQRLGEKIRPHLFGWTVPSKKIFLGVAVGGVNAPDIGECCSDGMLGTHIPLRWGRAKNVLT